MKFILGITGGTGSGKSTVTSYLKEHGARVVDADIVAREIVMPGKPALSKIKKIVRCKFFALMYVYCDFHIIRLCGNYGRSADWEGYKGKNMTKIYII